MAIKNVDPNQIDDVIIRKRALLYHSGGAPTTYTRLYLYPASVEVEKSRNLNDLLNAYGYFMPIPVSPSSLQYKRSASHNEAYGIVSGGLLQRNLPRLWHLSIETYLPKDILERVFHNWSQDKEWSGEYTQQNFVDYINLIMQYKIPLALYDSSSPERIRHNCEYWCIESFDYKMQPHDDIDYTLELIEWREPHVKLSEIEMTEITEPEKPKVRKGSGTALMVFGDNDSRAFNRGEVYNPQVKLVLLTPERPIGFDSLTTVDSALQAAADSGLYVHIDKGTWEAYTDRTSYSNRVITIDYSLKYPKQMPNATIPTVRKLASDYFSVEVRKRIYDILKGKFSLKLSYTPKLGSSAQGGELKIGGVALQAYANAFDKDAVQRASSYDSHLGLNAWCQKQETRLNVPRYKLSTSVKVNNVTEQLLTWTDKGTIRIELKKDGVWFKEMYVVRPIKAGTKRISGDLAYDSKQAWLVPKENTIITSYKKYLQTVTSTHQWETYYPNIDAEDVANDKAELSPEITDVETLTTRINLTPTQANRLLPDTEEGELQYTSADAAQGIVPKPVELKPLEKTTPQMQRQWTRRSGGKWGSRQR